MLVRGWNGPTRIKEVHQEGRWYTLENGRKAPYERLKLHFHNPNDWILLTNDDIGFVVNDEDVGSEEEISVSEDARSFREEQASLPASEEKLQMELEMPPSQMMTRSRMAEEEDARGGPLPNTIWSRRTCLSAPRRTLKLEPGEPEMDLDDDMMNSI